MVAPAVIHILVFALVKDIEAGSTIIKLLITTSQNPGLPAL